MRPASTDPLANPSAAPPGRRTLRAGALLLGVAASGFFDGIVLHQLLQWHHLLSGLRAPEWRDIERQILADGLFHALMYALAAWALLLLWRARANLGDALRDRSLLVDGLLGFGLWNVADTLLFHWLLGLHRVRMDSPYPLAWDIGWLLLTGGLPIWLAWSLHGRAGGGGAAGGGTTGGGREARRRPAGPRGGATAWAAIAVVTCAAAAWSARPMDDAPMVFVYFPAGTSGATVMAGVAAVDARVVDVNAAGTVWALAVGEQADREDQVKEGEEAAPPGRRNRGSLLPLYLHGARAMAEVPGWAGCAQRLKF